MPRRTRLLLRDCGLRISSIVTKPITEPCWRYLRTRLLIKNLIHGFRIGSPRVDGGTLDFYIDDAHIEELFPGKNYTRQKFTYQMSDHFPIWIQVKTDIETFRLNQLIQDKSE